jgi:hypothetical protein
MYTGSIWIFFGSWIFLLRKGRYWLLLDAALVDCRFSLWALRLNVQEPVPKPAQSSAIRTFLVGTDFKGMVSNN